MSTNDYPFGGVSFTASTVQRNGGETCSMETAPDFEPRYLEEGSFVYIKKVAPQGDNRLKMAQITAAVRRESEKYRIRFQFVQEGQPTGPEYVAVIGRRQGDSVEVGETGAAATEGSLTVIIGSGDATPDDAA